MTKELKQKGETQAPAPGKAQREEEEKESNSQQQGIDYKAELEKIKSDRDNYKKGLLGAKEKIKEMEEKKGEPLESSEIERVVSETIERKLGEFSRDQNQTQIDNVIAQMSDDEDEQKLIAYHYQNSLNPTGTDVQSIRRDVQRAKLLANESKYRTETSELKRSLKAHQTAGTDSMGSAINRRGPKRKAKLSKADRKFLEGRGYDPDKWAEEHPDVTPEG